jgi:hypothetical protein
MITAYSDPSFGFSSVVVVIELFSRASQAQSDEPLQKTSVFVREP